MRGRKVCGVGSTREAFPAAVASGQDCGLCEESVPELWWWCLGC